MTGRRAPSAAPRSRPAARRWLGVARRPRRASRRAARMRALSALCTGALIALLPDAAAAQGFRGEARLGSAFLEVRPLVRDSLPEGEVPGTNLRRRLSDGTVVTCTQGDFCRWYRAGEVESLVVTTQDLLLTGWTNVTGLSARVHLRGRYGSDEFWPMTDQELEAVSAYLDYDRSDYRARAGRIYRTDGLGYYNFDGISFLWRGFAPLWVEGYGGWSLPRGVNAPRTGDLFEEADLFAPDDRGLLFGVEAGGRVGRVLSVRSAYQRDIRSDRLALYSERLALDARSILGETVLELSAEYDWTWERFNEVRLRASAPVASGVEVMVEGRHYSPFFELWTIWGAFSPVGFNEGRVAVAWRPPDTGLRLEAGGGYRDYEETNAGTARSTIRDDGWRVFADGSWRRDGWFASAGYRAEVGFGAARFGGDGRVGRTFSTGTYLSARGTLTQTFGEFRLNEQLVSGIGVDGGVRVWDFTLNGGAAIYRVSAEERPGEGDWTQARLYGGLSYRFGMEPGRRAPDGGDSGAER